MTVVMDLKKLQVGLRCVLGTGGHRYAPAGVDAAQMKAAADKTISDICDTLIRLRAAEYVIANWGKEEEYRVIRGQLVDQVNALTQPRAKSNADKAADVDAENRRQLESDLAKFQEQPYQEALKGAGA